MKKVALITGITGQDGSYLAEFLLKKNYKVFGIKRRSSSFNTKRIDHIYDKPHLQGKFNVYYSDLLDGTSLYNIIEETKPDEIYNLAAQSHVRTSFDVPEYTSDVNALGTLRLLEAIRRLGKKKKIKFYQASTSEIFGNTTSPQSEKTAFKPASPYAISKLYAYWITKNYREAYKLFAVNGILFNHEGCRRGETFVTRKITKAVARIFHGKNEVIYLGNLDAKRDWGDAEDYIQSMWKMLQQKKPDDYVIATGKSYSVREFVNEAFKNININIKWKGAGLNECGYDEVSKRIYVKISKIYFRPTEVFELKGDARKAKKILKWKPKISFKNMVKKMVKFDIEDSKIISSYY
jgi:GDPmannose 4,6-dehydratase